MAHLSQQRTVGIQPGDVLVVVHDFDARSTDELTLRKTDRIELVELDDGFGDGWYLGRHITRGGTGLFPGVYTTKIPTPFPVHQNSNTPQGRSLSGQPSVGQIPYTAQSAQQSQQRGSTDAKSAYQGFSGTNGLYMPPSQTLPTAAIPDPTSDYQRPLSMTASQPSYISSIQRSIGQTLDDQRTDQDSPVMSETLNVIDEHMQDMHTPRQSVMKQELKPVDDSESEYSSHMDRRPSYVAGPETDEEEGDRLTEGEVKTWDYKQTANHLRSIGVDSKHCDIFEEQEISGDVLLEMDQAFIYMKEYDFGVMGRRLKTWHKIRDFQDEVKGVKMSRQTTSNASVNMTGGESAEDLTQAHGRIGSYGATILPRIPNLTENPALAYRPQHQSGSYMNDKPSIPPPLQTQTSASRASVHTSAPVPPWRASMGPDSPSRPSAALVRELTHSRRHSSIDFGKQPSYDSSPVTPIHLTTPHRKQASLDRDWSMTSASPLAANTTAPSMSLNTMTQPGYESSVDASLRTDPSSVDLMDRGYVSSGELDNRKTRKVLRKRESEGSPGYSRQSSMPDDPRKNAAMIKRHSRLSSVDSIRDLPLKITSPAAKAYHSNAYKGRMRSASARTPSPLPYAGVPYISAVSPTVTNLEESQSPNSTSPSFPTGANAPLGSFGNKMAGQSRARKFMGLRAISDAVTGNEKASASVPGSLPDTLVESPVDSPAGSNTPSATSRSFEIDNAESFSKGTEMTGSLAAPKASSRTRPKTKKETSAYTRGLNKVSPEEARKNCDYSGWMKKKSSSLLTTWKPRLFVLRGRRLSYYYTEADNEERGIIDISGHKVLVANSDAITTFHAAITGANSTTTPASGGNSAGSSPLESRAPHQPSSGNMGGPFYFKLVPPKVGLSRAVQFTKPTIHYFQVDNINEGRKWMGEMMKATIEHDLTSYETTNKQKTISLRKAKERRERPPALMETQPEEVVEEEKQIDEGQGLRISGLAFEKEDQDGGLATLIAGNPGGSVVEPDTGQKIRPS